MGCICIRKYLSTLSRPQLNKITLGTVKCYSLYNKAKYIFDMFGLK